MIEDELGTLHRYELQDRYLELTRVELPAVARQNGWSVQEDHCFMRIILDQLFQDCWYNHLDKRLTAYKQLGVQQLTQCVEMGQRILDGDMDALTSWNDESLKWRGKIQ